MGERLEGLSEVDEAEVAEGRLVCVASLNAAAYWRAIYFFLRAGAPRHDIMQFRKIKMRLFLAILRLPLVFGLYHLGGLRHIVLDPRRFLSKPVIIVLNDYLDILHLALCNIRHGR